ncbi:fungal-specific transcription factor domain-containing protein [Aspergillus karnatakaensis]|uniref:Zn(II)2Cys6 transcription factor n=1 Tax=Aspergillus karnatakaensis TaxID=1810916 RepID=UPI003CCDF9EA
MTLPPKTGSAPRSKTGCLTCRQRKKKCDERKSTCAACHRNNLVCRWQPADAVAPTRRPRRRRLLSDRSLPPELSAMVTVFALPSPDLVQRLLHHFTEHGPMWLTSRTGKNRTAVLFHLFPEAMESPLILNCVLMIAAEDLLKYDSNMKLQAAAVEYYGQAVAGLRSELDRHSQGENASDHTLLAVALFCLHEAQNYSSSSRFLPHVNAAAILLRQRLPTTPPNLNLRKFLIEMLCYFFSITAFSHGASLAFHEASPIFHFPGLDQYLQTGTIMGTSQKAFFIVFRLSQQLAQISSSPSTPLEESLRSELLNTAHDLRTTRPAFQLTPSMTAGEINDGVTFELYRLACLLYIEQTIDPSLPSTSPSIQTKVASFIAYLAQLPPESPSDGFLCWPLMITGIRAVERTHQGAIAARLRSTYERFRSKIFSGNLAVLRRWWKDGDGIGAVEGFGVGSRERREEYPVLLV